MADGRLLLRFSLSLPSLIRNKSLSARSARVIEMDRRRVCPLCNARAYLVQLEIHFSSSLFFTPFIRLYQNKRKSARL
jgi:hypothetical protein